MTSKYTNKNGVKLLAAVAVLALAVCSFAIIINDPADAEGNPIAITSAEDFTTALSTGGLYVLANDILDVTITENDTVVSKDVTIDLKGYTLNITSSDNKRIQIGELESASAESINPVTLTIKSTSTDKGKLTFNGFTDAAYSALRVGAGSSVVLENVNYETNGTAIYANGNSSTVSVNDSKITASLYAIGTNASATYRDYNINVNVENSTLITKGNEGDNSTILINVPNATLTVKNSTITGDRQAAFIRCGTATFENSTIQITDKYTGTDPEDWGTGNGVASAALVIGNKTSSSYIGMAKVTIDGGEIIAATNEKAIVTAAQDFDITGSSTIDLTIGKNKATEVSIGNNKISIAGLSATTAGFSITSGSIVVGGTTEVIDGKIVILSGEAKLTDDVPQDMEIVISEDATLKIENGIEIEVKGKVTNNGRMAIAGTLNGTIENKGDVEIAAGATTTDLQINGGKTSIADGASIPFVADGTEVIVNGKTFVASTVDISGGYKVMVGAECIAYDGKDHAGRSSVNMVVLAAAVEINNVYETITSISTKTISVYSMLVYQNEKDALAENINYGVCKDVGTYYVNFTSGLAIKGTAGEVEQNINTFFSGTIEFSIVPKAVTPEIIGTDDGNIPTQKYTGAEVVPTSGTDYDVYIIVDEQRVKLTYGVDYDITCTDNISVGVNTAMMVVTLKGNYSGNDDIRFTIEQEIVSLDITNNKGTYHVGEIIDTNELVVKGKFQNEETTAAYDYTTNPDDNNSYLLSITVFETSGTEIVVTVTSTNNPDVTGTFTVEVIGITSVTITNHVEEYTVGQSLDYTGMIATIVYEDGLKLTLTYSTNAFEQTALVDSEGANVAGRNFSNELAFEPKKFISQVGEVIVTVTYYEGEGEFTVTVDGFAIIYHVGDEVVATQAGTIDDYAAVYNYVWENSELFIAWEVEDFGTYYLPGDMIRFGENTEMWGDDDTLNLYAELFEKPIEPETPVDPSEDYIVSTSVVDDKVVVSVISLDGGYLVAGTEVTVTFTALEETTAFGQTIYKPTPVTKTITIGDDKPTISNNAYELADILGDKYAVINVVSTIGTTGYGNMSLNYKG